MELDTVSEKWVEEKRKADAGWHSHQAPASFSSAALQSSE
jgi:hypothetical protein